MAASQLAHIEVFVRFREPKERRSMANGFHKLIMISARFDELESGLVEIAHLENVNIIEGERSVLRVDRERFQIELFSHFQRYRDESVLTRHSMRQGYGHLHYL